MKKTYIAPALQVDEAVVEGLMALSIQLSNESGSEEYVKEQAADEDGGWDIDW